MAVIRLDPRHHATPARRVRLGPPAVLALQQRLERVHGVRLPPGLGLAVPPEVAVGDVDAELAAAAEELGDCGVLAGEGPAESVAANLASLVSSPRRIRLTVAGPEICRLGWYWVGARLGGSLVRRGREHELSLFDVRSWGQELLGLLPPAEHEDEGREAFTVPVEALGTFAAATDDAPVLEALTQVWGLSPEQGRAVHDWADGVRAVLQVSVYAGPDRPPGVLVWFLDRHGWWSGMPGSPGEGPVPVTVAPCRLGDLHSRVGSLVAEAWL